MNRTVQWMVVLVILGLSASYWFFWRKDPVRQAQRDREWATQKLAEYLVQAKTGRRALVISNPFAPIQNGKMREQEEAGIRGLRQGFGDKITLEAVVYPELLPQARQDPRSIVTLPGTPTPLSFMVTEDAFDKLIQQHPSCDLVVSLVGLPANLDKTAAWQQPPPPRFALFLPDLRLIGDARAVKEVVLKGKLAAFVCQKPERLAVNTAEEPASPFERQFLLVTSESIDGILDAYPRLLEPMGEGLP